MQSTLQRLNAPTQAERLLALETLMREREELPPVLPQYANNHIHTTYSFSPYSPVAAVWFARQAGLATAGIMDHDSIAGAQEFHAAARLLGVAATAGLECRVTMEGTPLAGKRINNPDQKGVAYMALHGVPGGQVAFLQERFAPLRALRNVRNEKMLKNCNALTRDFGITLTMQAVLNLSQYAAGGTVTERHILFALAQKITEHCGKEYTADFLREKMRLPLSGKETAQLKDSGNPYFLYDLLGVLKAQLVERVYVPAKEECLHIRELQALARQTGALFCYAYLGDVGESVTGDKKSQRFEDGYLDLLFDTLKQYEVDAVTYMPSRNTPDQLRRVVALCKRYGFLEISGEDINSPRQSFICKQLAQKEYSHLINATWQLIAREKQLSHGGNS